jgi:hypothetical protein
MKTPHRRQEAGFDGRAGRLERQLGRLLPGIPVCVGAAAGGGPWLLGIAIVLAAVLLSIDRARRADWLDGLIGIKTRKR